jgi:hypothetical protein
LAFLPSYSLQLNPVEYLWAHWKPHEMPNLCPRDFAEQTSRRRLLEAGLNGGQKNHRGAESAFLDASSRPAVQSSRQNFASIETFAKVVETGSFTAAAAHNCQTHYAAITAPRGSSYLDR